MRVCVCVRAYAHAWVRACVGIGAIDLVLLFIYLYSSRPLQLSSSVSHNMFSLFHMRSADRIASNSELILAFSMVWGYGGMGVWGVVGYSNGA